MKRLLVLILLLFPLVTFAQSTTLLEIDASSFAPVQTDVLSGVAIDKIGMDPSRRPCARIKMHINRMSKEEINGLSVRTVGGSVVVTKCVVASEGNGLIIELTAKSPTRFYLHHEKYGDSNEVSLNLEGNKEYRLEASLKTTHSIVIQSNVSGADVYVDNEYEGATGKNQALTVKGVYPGRHSIRVKRGSYEQEIQVEVNDDNVHFRLDIEEEKKKRHVVNFKIEPDGANLKIDGDLFAEDISEKVSASLVDGEHTYSVSADMHHEEKGTIILNGSNIDKTVRLRPAYGWLQVDDNADFKGASVYVDGRFVGRTPIKTDRLPSGEHTVRIEHHLYKPSEQKITIQDEKTKIFTPTLKPDYGWIQVSGDGYLKGATVYVDGEYVGFAPIKTGRLSRGEHRIRIEQLQYEVFDHVIDVKTGETVVFKPELKLEFVKVTLHQDDADIYVDGQFKGHSEWTGMLAKGEHIFESRKDGYYPTTEKVDISVEHPTLDYVFPAPTLITGTINVQSNKKADVYIDDEKVGKTPLTKDVAVGEHSVTLSRNGYRTREKEVLIKENEVSNVRILLSRDMQSEDQDGFLQTFELSCSHHTGHNSIVYENVGVREYRTLYPMELTYTIGYRGFYGAFWGIGSGVTWDLVDLRNYGDYLDPYYTQEDKSAILNYSNVSIPIFLNFKQYFTESVFQPMVSVSMGMYVSLPKEARNMFLWDLGFGCNYRIDRKKGAYLMFSMGGVPNLCADRLDVERKSSFALRIKAGFAL